MTSTENRDASAASVLPRLSDTERLPSGASSGSGSPDTEQETPAPHHAVKSSRPAGLLRKARPAVEGESPDSPLPAVHPAPQLGSPWQSRPSVGRMHHPVGGPPGLPEHARCEA
eukprot:3701950-Amphidinium_carterae.1